MDSLEALAQVSPTGPSKFEGYWTPVHWVSIFYLFACEGSLLDLYIYKYICLCTYMYSELKQSYSELFVGWEFISADTRGQMFSEIFYT